MRIRHLMLILAFALVLQPLLAGDAEAKKRRGGGWEVLGTKTVSDRADHDTLVVTRRQGTFRRVKVKVFDRNVEFREMTIHFASGEDQEVALRRVIPAGGESRVIDLQGGDRVIRSIEFRYDAQSLGGRTARVRVLGKD